MIQLDFKKQNGLIPCVVQDVETKQVLMLAYMNEESYQKTVETKLATYYSRSRKCLWVKGETSGHYQHVLSIRVDCDEDTILLWFLFHKDCICYPQNKSNSHWGANYALYVRH